MATRAFMFAALSVVVAVSPAVAAQAPAGTATTRYCLRVEPVTGSHIPSVACLTREEWADGDVDVDEVWAEDGVGIEN